MPLFDPSDAYTLRQILIKALPREDDWSPFSTPSYACGFYCSGLSCDSYLFSISIIHIFDPNGPYFKATPQVVWSANINHPVGENATMELTNGGDLLLRDANGTLVWSTGTDEEAVAGLNLTEMGNLVLFDANHSVVWDHPTDSLLVGQILPSGKNLTAAAAATNWSEGLYSVSMNESGLVASILSHPPHVCFQISLYGNSLAGKHIYAEFQKGTLAFYAEPVGSSRDPDEKISTHSIKTQYMKLEHDGHLRAYEWDHWDGSWKKVADILTDDDVGECGYPMVCGKYGLCTHMDCRCPNSSFTQINDKRPHLGCFQNIPLTCNASQNQTFLHLDKVAYFTSAAHFDIRYRDVAACKEACLKNCSCKAAMFRYWENSSEGYCYLPTEIFSLMRNGKELKGYNTSVSLKIVQLPAKASSTVAVKGRPHLLGAILGSTLEVFFVFVLIGATIFVCPGRKRRTEDVGVME